SAKQKLLEVRAHRIRPHLDDKILASWNGLMLGAIARAYAVLGDEAYRAAAEKDLVFLQAKLWDAGSKTLYHRWRDGERDNAQLLDDYAALLSGVIELYEATLEAKHLELALVLADSMIARFYDPEHGGFYQSAGTKDLILRVKEDYDGAEPSGNSVATLALLKLAAITDNKTYREKAEKTLRLLAQQMERLPQAVPNLLLGLSYWLEEPKRVVITGDPHSAAARMLLHAAHSVYQPGKVVLGTAGPVEPFAKTLPAKDGPTVYLCTGTACQPPTSDPAKLEAMLR
ncbi:MAG: thioredoxin domain-containing protein, partial [Pedosphaera parvula]|nr:thioredoxin domain-containing protein [Pedosphaera parvula]